MASKPNDGRRKNRPQFVTVETQARNFKAYPMIDSEIDTMGNLGIIEAIFSNFASVFLGAFLGSITAVTNPAASVIAWIVFWCSMVLAFVFGIVAGILILKRKNIKDEVRGDKS